MPDILIRNGRIICPDQHLDTAADLLVKDGKVAAIGRIEAAPGAYVIDAAGKIVCPGLVDVHVHFREPGDEQEETIASGSAAALAGGFTTVVMMPNTDPPLDSPAAVEFVINRARQVGLANVFPTGTISRGRKGAELSDMALLQLAGVAAFSDDGSWVASGSLMAKALRYARLTGLPVISHCEDPSLAGKGVMNGGALAARLGLPGIPRSAEEAAIARDVILAKETGGRLHVTHVSTAAGAEIIARAKAEGVGVTADVTPHHLTLTQECACGYDPVFRVSPPLRTQADVDALRSALRRGVIDAIASDHAPHAAHEKQCEFDQAAPGMIGLESTLAVLVTDLVQPGVLAWGELIAALTLRPARALGLAKGSLRPGADADVAIIDPEARWTIRASRFVSRSRNCPWDGKDVAGRVELVIVGGVVKEI